MKKNGKANVLEFKPAALRDDKSAHVHYTMQRTRDAAVAHTVLTVDGQTFVGEGTAKRAPGDAPNPTFGGKLALVRALENLQEEILASEGFYFED